MEHIRSVKVFLTNHSGTRLKIKDYRLPSGIWSKGCVPPDVIENNETAEFTSENDIDGYGTEGIVKYDFENLTSPSLMLNWCNPYLGGNTYTCYLPNGFSLTQTAGSENSTVLNVTITRRPDTY